MSQTEFGKTVAVLFEYGLRPTYWEGDLFIVVDPQRDLKLALAGDGGDEVPGAVLEILLEYAAMEESTFRQLYETI